MKPDAPAPIVRLRGVSKSYSGKCVLAPLDFALFSGKTYVLLGPSGCGKSTLLRLIVGLIQANAGEINFRGKPIATNQQNTIRQQMGYVIQEGGLFPHLTVRGNVTLLPTQLGWSREQCDARLRELAELTRLPFDLLDRYPAQLSGGQRQRVSLMRALALDPQLLLLDEPLGALDPMIRASLQDDLREIFRELKKTVVFVTHDLAEAEFFADEVLLMRAGKVMQRGTPDEFAQDPADPFVTEFLTAQRRER